MTLRYIDTAIWTDPWFETLSPEGKLLFIYSWSNDHMNAAGCTELSPKRVGLEIGISTAKVEKAIIETHPKIIYFQDFNILWAVKFLSKQTGAETFLKKVAKDLEKMPDSVAATVFAAHDKLSIPYTPCVEVIYNLTDTVLSCPDSAPKGKGIVKGKTKPEKITYAKNATEDVTMTEKEYQTLVKKHGQDLTDKFIQKLNSHKGARGQTYKDDYMAIHSWVIDAVTNNGQADQSEHNAEAKRRFLKATDDLSHIGADFPKLNRKEDDPDEK